MTYHNYEWTAFTEADFLDQGGNGTSIGKGDSFTMPGSSTVTMSTKDNDNKLSGDNVTNEKSNDQDGQDAYIDGAAVGGKMYAECYHVLKGSDGKTYYLIEIEIEGHNAPGAGDDYFTFYGAVPPAGVTLNVTNTCNVKGEWVDFACLGAGDSVPANTAPTFTNTPADGIVMLDENTSLVIDLAASDADGDALTYEIVGGADAGHFEIDANTGELSFINAPDFENPTSANGNNTYDVTVKVSDGNGGTEEKAMWVKVKDVAETGWIKGRFTTDADGNDNEFNYDTGQWDEGIAGATIELLDANGDVVATATTNANGNYMFDVPAGDYQVRFPTVSGTEFSAQNSGVAEHYDSDADANGLTAVIHVTAGSTTKNVDAGVKEGTVVCEETLGENLVVNGDFENNPLNNTGWGLFDSLPGWVALRDKIEVQERDFGTGNTKGNAVVELDANVNAIICQEVSVQEAGTYRFSIDYAARGADYSTNGFEIYIDGVLQETVNPDSPGFQTLTFEIDLAAGTTRIDLKGIGDSDCIGTVVDNVKLQLVTAGDCDKGSLSGTYFMDANDNDIQDAGDMAVAGATVVLRLNGVQIDSTTTDANGDYSFTDLEASDNYSVRFIDTGEGKTFVDGNVGNDDTIDSDVNNVGGAGNGNVTGISLAAGEDKRNVDAGIEDAGTASLEGRVFMDSDDDNQDNGEMGVSGVTVTLLNADGSATGRTTTTGTDGSYAFAGLLAGGYIVSFPTEVDGKTLVDSNIGNDATDSDALANGQTGVINLAIGENSVNNDAGIEDAGTASLGDKLFLDTNGNGQQDNGEAGVDGVEVTLTDADGNTTTTTTANGGMYLFDGLDAGDYTVDFADVDGFDFTTQNNGNDASDSDVDANGTTDPVSLAIGEENLTVDAGLVSEGPDAADDAAMTCANEEVTVDVLANDGATASTITQVGGQDIAEGETVTVGGVEVTLSGGNLVFDGEVAYESLDIGESAVATISYTVADDFGGTTMADVDVTFCGTAETLQEICDSLPATASIQVINENNPFGSSSDAYTIQITSGDARLDGVYAEAYCVAQFDSLLASGNGDDIDLAPIFEGALFCAVESEVPAGALETVGINGLAAAQNLDLINYILNQDFGSQGYTDAEVQGAVWALTDGEGLEELGFDGGIFVSFGTGDAASAQEILDDAFANGEGFEAGSGDIVGLIVDPADPAFEQPFIFGVAFDDLDCIC